MKDFLKKIKKDDITFLLALGVFVVVGIFRYYDENMLYHVAPWPILQSVGFNKLAMMVLVGSMFLFYLISIIKVKNEDKKMIYYLSAFLSVFLVPLFSTVEYLGTMDMYAWMILFWIVLSFSFDKMVWLSIPLAFIMMFISPMSVFNCGVLVLVLSLFKKNSLFICNIIAEVVAVILSISMYGLNTDAQYVLSITKFFAMSIMHIPYLIIAFVFFSGLIKKASGKKKIVWTCFVLGALPSILVNFYIGDYTRTILYTFMYFIVGVMFFMMCGDSLVISQMNETKEKVKEWVPIPVVLVAYPLLFVTFWIAGPVVLFTEVFTG